MPSERAHKWTGWRMWTGKNHTTQTWSCYCGAKRRVLKWLCGHRKEEYFQHPGSNFEVYCPGEGEPPLEECARQYREECPGDRYHPRIVTKDELDREDEILRRLP